VVSVADGFGTWESSDGVLIGMGGATGLMWALLSVFVGVQWWNGAHLPWWEKLLRGVLLWPLFAAFHVRIPGAAVFWLAIMTGLVTGLLGGFLIVLLLHRSK